MSTTKQNYPWSIENVLFRQNGLEHWIHFDVDKNNQTNGRKIFIENHPPNQTKPIEQNFQTFKKKIFRNLVYFLSTKNFHLKFLKLSSSKKNPLKISPKISLIDDDFFW